MTSPRSARPPLCLLPGPVAVHASVRRAFARAPISHRSPEFLHELEAVRAGLCALSGAGGAAIMPGSGTLANDVVAGQLSLLDEPGLIVCNGEFGERLLDHATRAGLRFECLRLGWGQPFDLAQVERALRQSRARWLWAAHCETSTGVLNPARGLGQACERLGARLCLDCVSSINTTALDLSRVHLASASSGKGLASLPGLAIVFFSAPPAPSPRLPRALDLGLHAEGGTPFTHSSNLVSALGVAVQRAQQKPPLEARRRLGRWLRARLRAEGFEIVAHESVASPSVATIALGPHACSRQVGERAERQGFALSWRSSYLLEHNWIQACLMGEARRSEIEPMFEVLRQAASP